MRLGDPPCGVGEEAFTYHRALAPGLWAIGTICCVELVVTHLLVAHWWPRVALGLSLLTLPVPLWLLHAAATMKNRPIILSPDALLVRVGSIRATRVPLSNVEGLRASWTADDLRGRSVLNLALVSYPNLLVDLRKPLLGRRGIRAIALRLDDPAAFASSLQRLGERDDRRPARAP